VGWFVPAILAIACACGGEDSSGDIFGRPESPPDGSTGGGGAAGAAPSDTGRPVVPPPGAPPPPSIEPLPATAFIFKRRIRERVDHVLAFDIATGQERLIGAFGDDGRSGGAALHRAPSLSHDRRWVAFASFFGEEVSEAGALIPAVSRISVDGKRVARVTSRLPDLNADIGLIDPIVHFVENPVWSPQDSQVLFSMGLSGFLPGGGPFGPEVGVFSFIWSSPASGGEGRATGIGRSCVDIEPVAFSHDGSRMAYVRTDCPGVATGLAIEDVRTRSSTVVLPMQKLSTGHSDLLIDQPPAWSPDDSKLLFLRRTVVQGAERWGLYTLSLAQNTVTSSLPPSATVEVQSFTLSRDGSLLVVERVDHDLAAKTERHDLWGGDPSQPLRRLTTSGNNVFPRF
jgi:hypothetical protein